MSATSMKVALMAFAALSLTAVEAQAYEAIANVESLTPTREIFNAPYQSCTTEYQQSVVTAPHPRAPLDA